jgi:hypothetical protein
LVRLCRACVFQPMPGVLNLQAIRVIVGPEALTGSC